jgi:hypothetical protein
VKQAGPMMTLVFGSEHYRVHDTFSREVLVKLTNQGVNLRRFVGTIEQAQICSMKVCVVVS